MSGETFVQDASKDGATNRMRGLACLSTAIALLLDGDTGGAKRKLADADRYLVEGKAQGTLFIYDSVSKKNSDEVVMKDALSDICQWNWF